MRKNYMKPEGKVVALRMNENISASGEPAFRDSFGITYNVVGDTKYIYTSTTVQATSSTDDRFNAFYDLILSFIHDLSNCRFDPHP